MPVWTNTRKQKRPAHVRVRGLPLACLCRLRVLQFVVGVGCFLVRCWPMPESPFLYFFSKWAVLVLGVGFFVTGDGFSYGRHLHLH